MELQGLAEATARQPEVASTRALIYHALAEALASPLPGPADLLLDAVQIGARVIGSAACRRAARALAELSATDVEVPPRYDALPIFASGGRPVALYESLHRHGRIGGQATWEVEQHYRGLGLAPANGELADHASVELAFLGHLAAGESEAWKEEDGLLAGHLRAEQKLFLSTHAGVWLPEVGAALAATDVPFHAVVGHLLRNYLTEEMSVRKRGVHRSGQLPYLKDATGCTLCGLCAGSCPRGALRMLETSSATALSLNPSQCNGCGRCAGICPDGLLDLCAADQTGWQVGATDGDEYRTLRQDGRAACPSCSKPTVSQAELDAVFSRLRPNPDMQHRMSLCVECKLAITGPC